MVRRVRRAIKILWMASVVASLVLLFTFSDSFARVRLATSSSSFAVLRNLPNATTTEAEDEDEEGREGKDFDRHDGFAEDYGGDSEDLYVEGEDEVADELIPGDEEIERLVAEYEYYDGEGRGEEHEQQGERGGEIEQGQRGDRGEETVGEGRGGEGGISKSLVTTDVSTTAWYAFVGRRFAERRARVKRVCEKYRNPVYSKTLTRNSFMYYSEKYKLMVCIAAKVGSSTWKSHLLHMRGLSPITNNIHAKYFENKIKAKLLLGTHWTIKAMQNSTKVMTVRHPLERLVSAFRDKFLDGKAVQKAQSDGHLRYFWKPAMKALKKGRTAEGKLQITFREFLQYVVREQRSSAGDPHWMRLYRMCSVCGIDFPFVMRLETYAEDLAFLVRNLGIEEVDPMERRHALRPDNAKSLLRPNDASKPLEIDTEPAISIKNSTLKYYLDVPPELLASVLDIYKVDLEMFRYQVPPAIQNVVDLYRNRTA
ncbi:carbohydrate sulfotransferase 8 [Penaeus vannamei]|uniref:carbohydrate sulfotransferase 8 n=1 Tax=Penaeus vannamei TaxID=6689 RepID=UPI00387F3E18